MAFTRPSQCGADVEAGRLLRALLFSLGFIFAMFPILSPGQTALLDDAWWTYQQDCNGDGCFAGTLASDHARLNWNPDVFNCNGTLTVYEVVSTRTCGSSTWTAFYTNSPHVIVGCRSSDAQYLDIPMGNNCACWDYKIDIYRNGQSSPDASRSPDNDPDLSHHKEEFLAQDFCASDYFATCAALEGTFGSRSDNNTAATKEPGEPNHAGDAGGKSLWYCWTAPANTPVTFDTVGSSFDTLLAVYTGETVSSLSLIASNDDIASSTNRQSRVTFVPSAGTTYHIAVDGFGGAAGMVFLNWNQSGAPLPDLILYGAAVSPSVITRTFTNGDCEVVEGCEVVGTRRLLTFNTETRNIGAGDLVLGDPSTNSLFHYASCHGHYHFEEFASYTLFDTNGNVMASGHKVGFCVLDDHAWSPTANPQRKYTCSYQGLQAGWADVYPTGLPCQYIDVTGVPAGNYLLQMIVNPAGLIAEADTNNNVTTVPVEIPPTNCPARPPNDNFANAIVVTSPTFTYSEFNECATKESGEPNHAGDSGGHSVWFTWIPTVNQTAVVTTKGSDFDTLLAVYTGNSVSALTLVASDDDIIPGTYIQSQVSFSALAGIPYHIAVDGWAGAVGTIVLNINPPANDDFANAAPISGASGTISGITVGASKEPYEPAHAADVGGHSVWFQWTAPIGGPIEFNTTGSTFNTILAVYTGNSVTGLTVIAANNDDVGGVLTSRLSFVAVAGVAYQIAVDGFGGDVGNVRLNWNMASQIGITAMPNGVQLNFTGVNWQRYGLLVSSNLTTWSTQALRTMAGGFQSYYDSAGSPIRFYRTVLLP